MHRFVLFVLFGLLPTHVVSQCSKPCTPPPQYTISPDVDDELIEEINFYFPESALPPIEFISDDFSVPALTYVIDAPLKMAFVFEGAGYRNKLGYFTFNYGSNGQPQIIQEFVLFEDINDVSKYLFFPELCLNFELFSLHFDRLAYLEELKWRFL